jgi:DNA-binding NarL/FixJ family response regulator
MKKPMDAASREAHSQTLVPRSSMLSGAAWVAIAGSFDLSKRQIEIIHAVLDDATEYTIGQDLGISLHTVHTHLERIYHKLGVHDRIELVLRVLAEFLRLTADAGSGLPPICGRRAAGECPFQHQVAGK